MVQPTNADESSCSFQNFHGGISTSASPVQLGCQDFPADSTFVSKTMDAAQGLDEA